MDNIPSAPQMLEFVSVLCDEVRPYARRPVSINEKADGSLVTEVDLRLNGMTAEWAQQFDVDFIGEEGFNPLTDAVYALYLDPLDGTSTFTAGKAEFSTVLTLMQRGKNGWYPIITMVGEPMSGDIWIAEKGSGVRMQRRGEIIPSRVEEHMRTEPKFNVSAITWTGVPHHLEDVQRELIKHPSITEHGSGNTAINGPLIACGWMHGVLFAGSSAVESASIKLMVEEAGGVVTDLFGEPIVGFELGTDRHGKPDFILPHGIIATSSQELTDILVGIVEEKKYKPVL